MSKLRMGLTWEQRARALWQILDDVDTMSDVLKDDAAHGRDTCKRVQQRHEYLVSDGHSLFTPEDAPEEDNTPPAAPPPDEDGR